MGGRLKATRSLRLSYMQLYRLAKTSNLWAYATCSPLGEIRSIVHCGSPKAQKAGEQRLEFRTVDQECYFTSMALRCQASGGTFRSIPVRDGGAPSNVRFLLECGQNQSVGCRPMSSRAGLGTNCQSAKPQSRTFTDPALSPETRRCFIQQERASFRGNRPVRFWRRS